MPRQVVLVAGRDIIRQRSGGGANYVRAHGRALHRLGYEPHIFCIAPRDAVVETDFGVVHEVAARFRQFPRLMQAELRDVVFPFDRGRLSQAVEDCCRPLPQPILLHGFALGAYIAVQVGQRLRNAGRTAITVASAFTTRTHESMVRRQWAVNRTFAHRLNYGAQDMWFRALIRRLEQRAFTEADLILVNYDAVRRILVAEYGRHAPLRKITYASELTFLDAADQQGSWSLPPEIARLQAHDAPLIVSVSRHDPRKGVDVLIMALAHLRDRGVLFRACLVGPGVLRRDHEALIAACGLGNSVVITGWVEDPRHYMAAADVYVLPSLEEGSGSVSLLEAMALARAVLVTAVDGLPEDITDGENGLIAAPDDANAIVERLELMLADAALRRRLGNAARATFVQRFTAEAFVSALGSVYSDLGYPPD